MPRKDGPNFHSRFSETEFESWRNLFKQGKAFDVSIIDPKGQIVAGIFGYINRAKGILQGESVFYQISLKVDIESKKSGEVWSKQLVWDSKTFTYTKGSYEEIKSYFESATKYEKCSPLF